MFKKNLQSYNFLNLKQMKINVLSLIIIQIIILWMKVFIKHGENNINKFDNKKNILRNNIHKAKLNSCTYVVLQNYI